MNETIANASKQLNDFWARLDKKNRWMLIAFAMLVLVVAVCAVALLGKKDYEVLYSGLESADAGEIVNRLGDMGENYKTGDGGTIMVDKGRANTLRMQLASEGLPKNSLSYEIFQQSQSMGNTDFERQKFWQIQLQERLAATIESLDNVTDAIVTINLPENGTTVMREDKIAASAAVLVSLQRGTELTTMQVRAIKALMLKGVPGLTAENLTIVDSTGTVPADIDTDNAVSVANAHFDIEKRVREGLQRQLAALFEPVYGVGNVTPSVQVRLNFDKRNTESITFAPVTDGGEGIAISMSTLKEDMTNVSPAYEPGQDPNGAAPFYPATAGLEGTYKKTSETVNYEVNQIKDMIEHAEGSVTDLSVSILVNSQDMSDEERAQVADLVATAIGVDANRVTVRNMVFTAANELQSLLEQYRDDREMVQRRSKTIQTLIIVSLLLLALILLAWIIFSQVRKKRTAEREAEELLLREMQAQAAAEAATAAQIDLEHKNEYLEQIREFIHRNPESVAHLLRNWLSEDDI